MNEICPLGQISVLVILGSSDFKSTEIEVSTVEERFSATCLAEEESHLEKRYEYF